MNVIDLENSTGKLKVGRLDNKVISAFNLGIAEMDIILWHDRIGHLRNHFSDYSSEAEFVSCVNSIPDIIANPDYISRRPGSTSIEFIKRVNRLMIVAVRVKNNGALYVRSAYPLSEKQLNDYITHGSAKKV